MREVIHEVTAEREGRICLVAGFMGGGWRGSGLSLFRWFFCATRLGKGVK